jgi:hypothetical protein
MGDGEVVVVVGGQNKPTNGIKAGTNTSYTPGTEMD